MLFEGLMGGRTLGKLVTRTRVVSDGEMWHDSWSRTAVMTTRAPRYITASE